MVILYHRRPGGLWARAAVVAAGLVRPGSGGCRALVQLRPIQNQPARNRSGAERAYDWITFATGAGLRSVHKIRLMASVPVCRHCCGGRAGMAGRFGGQGLQLVLRGGRPSTRSLGNLRIRVCRLAVRFHFSLVAGPNAVEHHCRDRDFSVLALAGP